MKNIARIILAALVLAAVPFAFAADAPIAVGTWDAVASTPNGDMPSVIVIKLVDGALKAEMEIGGVPRSVSGEKLEGDVFKMTVQYDGGAYDTEVKIAGDTFEGTWHGVDASGTVKAKRRP